MYNTKVEPVNNQDAIAVASISTESSSSSSSQSSNNYYDFTAKPDAFYNNNNNNNVNNVTNSSPGVASPMMVSCVEYPYRFVHGLDSRRPVTLTYCPNCTQEHVTTFTKSKANGITWVCVGVGVAVFWPLCWVPLVAKPFKQTNHYCKNCGVKVGQVKPFQ